jgi:predicted RNA-binding Zn-ribbon protein involved in translation (DUF1610 family)
MQPSQKPELVAPCGMDCNICKWYLAFSRGIPKQKGKVSHCAGCRPREKNCAVKRECRKLRTGQLQFCYDCSDLPCKNIARLQKRYLEQYETSFLENLRTLKEKGMEIFLETQRIRFACPNCGDLVSVHDQKCYSCGKIKPTESKASQKTP